MSENIPPPFSARNRRARSRIDNDFPDTARIGLLHLLDRLIAKGYVEEWKSVALELQRIARVRPDVVQYTEQQTAEQLLMALDWDKLFDFCERLHSYLPRELFRYDRETGEDQLVASRRDIQEEIAAELQRLFIEENLAFEFSNGTVYRRGRRHTADRVASAQLVLGDPRLIKALTHFNKALAFFRTPSNPDFENAVKEAVCAVEAAARALFPSTGATLADVVKSITGSGPGQLPKPIAQTFHGLYGFRSGGQGIGHGGAEGGTATKQLAEYSLSISASQIVLLVDLASSIEEEVPF